MGEFDWVGMLFERLNPPSLSLRKWFVWRGYSKSALPKILFAFIEEKHSISTDPNAGALVHKKQVPTLGIEAYQDPPEGGMYKFGHAIGETETLRKKSIRKRALLMRALFPFR